ncbi:hypothetical protein C8F01DRAFT_382976 [Mycena amicta]|nr:hypothetical protein C8F01DRAFT_382976 [Mycena amicta]
MLKYQDRPKLVDSRLVAAPRLKRSRQHIRDAPSSSAANPTVIESLSLFTTVSTVTFSIGGGVETFTATATQTVASLVPFNPTQTLAAAPINTSFPVIPVAAAGGGVGLVLVLVSLFLLLQWRRRRRAPKRCAPLEGSPLEIELGRVTPANPTAPRSFSRLTFSAPYVLPRSPTSHSTAPPSTISVGQQYHVAPSGGRL